LPAASKQFEPTYFWDALTPNAIAWLNEHTPTGRSILFSSNPENWNYLYRWRIIQAPAHSPDLDGVMEPAWYVLQHRTAMLRPGDRWLLEHGKPAFQVSKLGVPLLSIYPIEQYRQAREAAK
jgi:hypothetical protein